MNPLSKVRTFRVEKRALFLLGGAGILLACALAFFGHQYFALLHERTDLLGEVGHLKGLVSTLQEEVNRASLGLLGESPKSLPVMIDELQVIRQPKRAGFATRFRLVQQNPQDAPYSGTLVMVAKNDTIPTPVYRVIPDMSLENGIPKEPARGKQFEVKGQKFVEAFFDGSSGEVLHTLTVYLYSPEGRLILQESTEIPQP